MMFVDVHAHLDFPAYEDDLKEVVQGCIDNNVKAVVINGVHRDSNRAVLDLSSRFSVLKPALGFYPTHVAEISQEKFDEELDFIRKSRCVGFGEVGLDFKFLGDNVDISKKKQLHAFESFMRLSEKTRKPMIVHSRKAELEVLDLLESSNARVVLHCFSGKKRLVERAADHGFNFSVPVSVIKLQQFQDLVKYTSINQLLTETDSPYLAPVPGTRNVPWNVSLAVAKIAELKGLDVSEVSKNIYMNYQKLF